MTSVHVIFNNFLLKSKSLTKNNLQYVSIVIQFVLCTQWSCHFFRGVGTLFLSRLGGGYKFLARSIFCEGTQTAAAVGMDFLSHRDFLKTKQSNSLFSLSF